MIAILENLLTLQRMELPTQKDDDTPNEWPKGTIYIAGDAILNGINETFF